MELTDFNPDDVCGFRVTEFRARKDYCPTLAKGNETMKRLFIIAASVALASASATAADMAARPYTKAPPPAIAAVYDWSGFYVGANAGYATSRNCWNFESFNGLPFTAGQGCHDADGAVAGGQIGYRWQAAAFVFVPLRCAICRSASPVRESKRTRSPSSARVRLARSDHDIPPAQRSAVAAPPS